MNASKHAKPKYKIVRGIIACKPYHINSDGAVMVTVTFANLGTATGAPEQVAVTLLDNAGNIVVARPIAVREAALAPGDERTITARLSVPPDGIEGMKVTIREAGTTREAGRRD